MIKADIRVTAQYQENYGNVDAPYWKNKGGVEFIISQVASEEIMYSVREDVDAAIERMLSEQSNDSCKYILIDWEFTWSEPVIFKAERLYKEMGIAIS